MKLASAAALLSCLSLSCLATAPEARTGGATASSVVPPGRLLAYDGDIKAGGDGWCTGTPCKVDGKAEGKTGRGVKAELKGKDWVGFGWNWVGWSSTSPGDNIEDKKKVHFAVKIDAPSAAAKPDPQYLEVFFDCSCKGKTKLEQQSNHFKLTDLNKEVLDGQWHELTIPADELYQGKGANFDGRMVLEIVIGAWQEAPMEFTVYLDDLYFE